MFKQIKKTSWSPYTVGIFIGLITWVTFLFMLKAPGISTTFVRLTGFLVGLFSVDTVLDNDYLARYVAYKPVFEWQFMLVVGILIGAFISAKLSGITLSPIPLRWGKRFGHTMRSRAIGAFIGGFLLLFGARMAGGCTMGHGISGGLQLAVASWLFMAIFFPVGIIVAHVLYRK